MKKWLCVLGLVVPLAGCAAPATSMPPTEMRVIPPTETATEAPTEVTAEPTQSTEPQRVEFESEDGTLLVGTYFPAASGPAPAVLLIHQHSANREAWKPLTDALAGSGYAMFAIDLPGHGESEGRDQREAHHTAIQSALAYLRMEEGVDPGRIVMIGASLGADGVADNCGEGCVGVISFSPGSFLGVQYTDALTALKERDIPVLCMAAQADSPSPQTCEQGDTVGLSDYQFMIYDGRQHGNALASATDITPLPTPLDLTLSWLEEHLPVE